VENGTGQLADILRNDPRVHSFEGTDIRGLAPGLIPNDATFAAVDVSFISLTLVMENVVRQLSGEAELVCLVKPQYESGPGAVNRRGIVTCEKTRKRAVERVAAFARELSLTVCGWIPSPAPTGNREYLMYIQKTT
jgi:23S rRNA (cytidine1920-2'-O)/16S rRNA (cytidine1409-2'-O)-methyltransferase